MIKKAVVRVFVLGLAVTAIFTSTGCIAIPPLINVTHKDDEKGVNQRLDSIERRLQNIENKVSQQQN